MQKNRGFTLVELIIVIAIAGIVLAIAAPNFTGYRQNTNLKEATRNLSADIQYWKQRAVAENRSYRISFDTAGNSYSVLKREAPPGMAFKPLSEVDPGASNIDKSPADISPGVSLVAAPATVTMDPRGTLSNGTIRLQHGIRLSTADIVTSLPGRVRIVYDLK